MRGRRGRDGVARKRVGGGECIKGWKWRENHRGGGVSAVKSCYATPFSVAGVLHLLKMEEKNSFAISARCPEGPGLPQSHRSVLLSPACVLLSR